MRQQLGEMVRQCLSTRFCFAATWAIHEKLYAKVIINSAKIRVEYYTRDHELYSELTQEFER